MQIKIIVSSDSRRPIVSVADFSRWIGSEIKYPIVVHGMHSSEVTLSKDFPTNAEAQKALIDGFEVLPNAEQVAAQLVMKGWACFI